jgi:predicted DNA-binding transcriptional regulator AlpA
VAANRVPSRRGPFFYGPFLDSHAHQEVVKLLSRRELLERVPISYPNIWMQMRDGKFPRSRAIGGKVVWLESEIDEWITNLPITQLKGDTEAA